MSFEESYYENTDIWAIENISEVDRQRIAILAEKLPLDVKALLDVGCGNGIFLEHLLEMKGRCFSRLCGTDRSTVALSHVRTEKVQANIDSLPFANNEFDIVSCLEVLEHLPQIAYTNALDELVRIARRFILVSVPYNENLQLSYTECIKCCCRFNPNYHLRTFNQQTMQHLFDDKGFTCREVFFMHPQKIVPTDIEVILRLLGAVKRTILRQPRSPMATQAVCPACGYSPREGGNVGNDSSIIVPQTNSLGMSIRSLLSLKSGWRWIGALYERV